ncbi:DUF1049 domain-containing protein [Alphaproteobacteria bacterium GH1-50]|uniref:DUF1049 domain-containing protein n=1 Tax=Kangsaoukella pontilimi TaxID=2691042 RepID=A0A7C9MSE2_9RHOB|nr:LapA family protein [Kangsaoukella pontilimi]MXQ09177.1 DUF1049 domain-containing protein [Kangsaoukella pontilimi]
MRYIRSAVLAVIAIFLITIALANRGPMTLRLMPEPLQALFGIDWEVTLPVFVILVIAVAVGVFLGFVWEWVREHKHRAAATTERRQRQELEKQVRATAPREKGGDDILALVEKS